MSGVPHWCCGRVWWPSPPKSAYHPHSFRLNPRDYITRPVAGGSRSRCAASSRSVTPLRFVPTIVTLAPNRLGFAVPVVSAGWVLLIGEESEQARLLVALLISILFLSLHLSIKPMLRPAE